MHIGQMTMAVCSGEIDPLFREADPTRQIYLACGRMEYKQMYFTNVSR